MLEVHFSPPVRHETLIVKQFLKVLWHNLKGNELKCRMVSIYV